MAEPESTLHHQVTKVWETNPLASSMLKPKLSKHLLISGFSSDLKPCDCSACLATQKLWLELQNSAMQASVCTNS